MNAKFCTRCKKANNGNGVWLSNKEWSDEFLTEAVANIIKRGKIRHIICDTCTDEIRNRGHKIRKRGEK